MLRQHPNRIYLLLLAATAVTFALGESGWVGRAPWASVLLMFGLAATKAYWVMMDFMELRHAPAFWARLMSVWLTVVLSGIGLAYAVGMRA